MTPSTSLEIDDLNDVTIQELGLLNSTLVSRVQLVGDRVMDFAFTPEPLPADGQLAGPLTLDVTIDGVVYEDAVQLDAASTANNASAVDLIRDIRDA